MVPTPVAVIGITALYIWFLGLPSNLNWISFCELVSNIFPPSPQKV